MKRIFCALLAAAMLLLPCMALADVILEPEDSFYKRYSDQCTYQAGRTYIAEGEGGSAPVYKRAGQGGNKAHRQRQTRPSASGSIPMRTALSGR